MKALYVLLFGNRERRLLTRYYQTPRRQWVPRTNRSLQYWRAGSDVNGCVTICATVRYFAQQWRPKRVFWHVTR